MRKVYVFLIALAVLGIDQWSKFWVRANLSDFRTLDIIPNHFRLYLNFNTGGAWSILSGNVWLLALVSTIVSIGVIVYILRTPLNPLQSVGMALLLGGATGNLFDRVLMQRVTDFFDAYNGLSHFPTFNVADMAIDGGVALLLLMYAFMPEKKAELSEESEK